jgi:hypothetical protein
MLQGQTCRRPLKDAGFANCRSGVKALVDLPLQPEACLLGGAVLYNRRSLTTYIDMLGLRMGAQLDEQY